MAALGLLLGGLRAGESAGEDISALGSEAGAGEAGAAGAEEAGESGAGPPPRIGGDSSGEAQAGSGEGEAGTGPPPRIGQDPSSQGQTGEGDGEDGSSPSKPTSTPSPDWDSPDVPDSGSSPSQSTGGSSAGAPDAYLRLNGTVPTGNSSIGVPVTQVTATGASAPATLPLWALCLILVCCWRVRLGCSRDPWY
jgi:hypothetical protein